MGERLLRLYAAHLPQVGGSVALSDFALRHARVVRLSRGDPVQLFDGVGTVAQARVATLDHTGLCCEIEAIRRTPLPQRRLHLMLGLTKGEKPDLVVRMATELGVASIQLVECVRSVVQARVQDRRVERLRVIAREACGQSGQPFAPHIATPVPLVQGLEKLVTGPPEPGQVRLVLHPPAGSGLPALAASVTDVWVLVGPEGGLSGEELAALDAKGFMAVSISAAVLRAETAAVVAAARLMERFDRPGEC